MGLSHRRNRSWILIPIVTLILYTLYSFPHVTRYTSPYLREDSRAASGGAATVKARVPLEAHIMSKCPDAKDCLNDLILPVMMRVSEKVDFTTSYIGTPTENDGVDCKHGPAECMGNILELCAARLYPDPKINLGFTMCLTRDYQEIPQRELVQACALEHAIDFGKLNECANKDYGAFGVQLLRESVQRSTEAGVTKSCTVRLDNKIYCIRDGGEWKDCPGGPGVNDLVIAVEKLYGRS